jgi:hypothetical protein
MDSLTLFLYERVGSPTNSYLLPLSAQELGFGQRGVIYVIF